MSRPRRLAPALLGALLGAALLSACTGSAADGGDGVVVTTNILGDITREVVGDEADVTVLMKPDADPHSFGVSAQQAATIERAGLVVHNGLGLEEGVARNVEAAAEAGVPTLAVGEEVDPLPYTSDESAGQLDPHFWTDPRRVRTATELVSAAVIEHVAGVDAAAVRANTEAYLAELDALDTWMTGELASVPAERRALVTNHHVFGYLADRYGYQVVGAVIPSGTTLASPSASDLESLAGAVREHGVPAIFADSSQPDRLAQVLAEEAGVDVQVVELHSESLTAEGGGAATYLEMARANTEAIVTALTADR
ncbi:zinc ABC transporter substrate-binding protein AztC [Streptomyces sp. DSM 44915]|uniref:Zinc ABC transporter substrate-binding protein AztC n=1 Tax=Streptomyces chisholmiae TaxID=3075540 RepID=A0ABU2JPM8_9ACTN|nr:zinc ABC transporter substrate-binding protein AztC [Streptomyces sp. DSM 44915]MDT0266683.1 zinc ABC transporter substrate-binding protein AztC [Streptomyces sp. DSM 44915]